MAHRIQITRGTPTDEEVAALVSALLAAPRGEPARPPVPGRWARSARPAVRLGVRGPDAWRACGLPLPR